MVFVFLASTFVPNGPRKSPLTPIPGGGATPPEHMLNFREPSMGTGRGVASITTSDRLEENYSEHPEKLQVMTCNVCVGSCVRPPVSKNL